MTSDAAVAMANAIADSGISLPGASGDAATGVLPESGQSAAGPAFQSEIREPASPHPTLPDR